MRSKSVKAIENISTFEASPAEFLVEISYDCLQIQIKVDDSGAVNPYRHMWTKHSSSTSSKVSFKKNFHLDWNDLFFLEDLYPTLLSKRTNQYLNLIAYISRKYVLNIEAHQKKCVKMQTCFLFAEGIDLQGWSLKSEKQDGDAD